MSKRDAGIARVLEDQRRERYKEAFKARKHLPKTNVLKYLPGTWLQVKWEDAPDCVVLLLMKPKRGDSLIVWDPSAQDRPLGEHYVEFEQVIARRGFVSTPKVVKDLF